MNYTLHYGKRDKNIIKVFDELEYVKDYILENPNIIYDYHYCWIEDKHSNIIQEYL